MKAIGLSDKGMKRSANEDSFFIDETMKLFIVADGMGGHLGGKEASRMAVEEVARLFAEHINDRNISPINLIRSSIYSANKLIYARGQREWFLRGMGTTVSLLYLKDNEAWIGHVGDSRIYLCRHGNLSILTRDHSWVSEQLKAGFISEEQAQRHFMKNVITRSVGYKEDVEVDTYRYDVKDGDVFLLCSDGLSNVVSESEMLYAIEDGFDMASEKLIRLANERGGPDNITVVLVRVEDE